MKFKIAEELSDFNFGSEFVKAGKANEKKITEKDVDAKELEMGMKVEMEHTTSKDVAKKIALDHLAEIKDYYTRLAKMEDEAKKAASEVKSGGENNAEDKDKEEEKKEEGADEEDRNKQEGSGELTKEQEDKIIEFIKNQDNLDDDAFHKFAEDMGVDPHEAEEVVYKWANDKMSEEDKKNSLKV